MNKVVLYFGSFNPVHAGHTAIARYVVEHGFGDQLWFVVSPHNPLKTASELAPQQHRAQMLRLAIASDLAETDAVLGSGSGYDAGSSSVSDAGSSPGSNSGSSGYDAGSGSESGFGSSSISGSVAESSSCSASDCNSRSALCSASAPAPDPGSAFASKFKVCDIEFSMPKPSYTINTLDKLQQQFADSEFIILMGEDNFVNIKKWREWQRIVAQYEIVVYPRSSDSIQSSDVICGSENSDNRCNAENIHGLNDAYLCECQPISSDSGSSVGSVDSRNAAGMSSTDNMDDLGNICMSEMINYKKITILRDAPLLAMCATNIRKSVYNRNKMICNDVAQYIEKYELYK